MAIFRRKKKEDEEKESKTSKPRAKRQKKKEASKPWGRRERLLVLAIFVLSAGSSALLGINSRGWKLPGLPRFKMPEVNIPFVSEETIVIEGNKEEADKAKRAKSQFVELTSEYSGIYALYIIRLGNGSRYGVNEEDVLQAASLIKLPVMIAAYKEAEAGSLNLDEKYTLKASDKVAGAGSLYGKPVGFEVTYRELLRLMGKQSDNTAFRILTNTLGEEKIIDSMESIGMLNTSLSENTTTPSDIGGLFESLYNGNLINEKNKEELLEFLTDTVFESWVSEGVPDDVRVAHKFGRETHVVNDAGVVLGDQPYVIVVMGDKIIEREADELIPKISRMVYEVESE
jgi:beta-lactamase class A